MEDIIYKVGDEVRIVGGPTHCAEFMKDKGKAVGIGAIFVTISSEVGPIRTEKGMWRCNS